MKNSLTEYIWLLIFMKNSLTEYIWLLIFMKNSLTEYIWLQKYNILQKICFFFIKNPKCYPMFRIFMGTFSHIQTIFYENHDFQNIKGYSLKIIENSEFMNFQKRVGEKQFPAITLTWYYQFARNLQLWYSLFNAHSMVYIRILG